MKPMAALALLLAALATLALAARGRLDRADFPPGFLFGTATSAYQIEGAYMEDNKSLSNWDAFTHTRPDGIADGRNGDVAADHYHLYKEDVDMMHDLGVNSYRFSISWARILPRGQHGSVNHAGVAFYNRLINTLLQKGIEPFVTLHHFDYPYGLETQYGGWLGAGMREEFEHYADVCFKAFGDRVKFWTTFNEPNLFTKYAYILGYYPPNRCSAPFGACNAGDSRREPYIVAHNMLLSHAAAVRKYKRKYQAKQGGSIGIALAMKWYVPLTNSTEDIMAARRALSFEVDWFLHPIYFGDYPREMRDMLSSDLPEYTSEERRLLVQNKMDFIGVNHYTAIYAKDCISSPCDLKTYEGNALVIALGERDGVPIGKPTAIAGCFDVPQGMEMIIKYVNQRYKNAPVYVTENGYAQYNDNSMEDLIADVGRKDFMQGYLTSLSSAARRGANLRGYFAWSLMDNFEWTFGFTIRFGLYHVDFKTQKRTPKMSAKWYRSFLKASGPVYQVQTLRADS